MGAENKYIDIALTGALSASIITYGKRYSRLIVSKSDNKMKLEISLQNALWD